MPTSCGSRLSQCANVLLFPANRARPVSTTAWAASRVEPWTGDQLRPRGASPQEQHRQAHHGRQDGPQEARQRRGAGQGDRQGAPGGRGAPAGKGHRQGDGPERPQDGQDAPRSHRPTRQAPAPATGPGFWPPAHRPAQPQLHRRPGAGASQALQTRHRPLTGTQSGHAAGSIPTTYSNLMDF